MGAPHDDQHEPEWYAIRLKGRLNARWAAWFDGMTLTREGDGTTRIQGPVADRAALHGLLQRVRDLGLPLLAVTQVEPARANRSDSEADTERESL